MNIEDDNGNTLATVIRFKDIHSGKNFITDNQSEFQLASFGLEENTVIERHYHPNQNRFLSISSLYGPCFTSINFVSVLQVIP